MELLEDRREEKTTLPNDSDFFPHLGTLGWYDVWNSASDFAAPVHTLQNQLEERGWQFFSYFI